MRGGQALLSWGCRVLYSIRAFVRLLLCLHLFTAVNHMLSDNPSMVAISFIDFFSSHLLIRVPDCSSCSWLRHYFSQGEFLMQDSTGRLTLHNSYTEMETETDIKDSSGRLISIPWWGVI